MTPTFPRVDAVLFDAGGTLIHLDGERIARAAGVGWSEESFARAEAEAVARLRAWIATRPESTDAERVPLFLDAILVRLGLADDAERKAAARRVGAEHARANLWSRSGRGAKETLTELSARGYRLGVVSNADGRVRRLLDEAGLAPLLEVVVDSAEAGFEKPDPRIFTAATDRLALPPARCAYVGDIYEIDVEGARAAGLQPILIGSAEAPAPVTRVADLSALLELLP